MLTGRLYGLAQVMSSAPMLIRPDVGSSSPATIRRVVVLPQPDGPSRAKKDPRGIVNVRSSTATKSPNRFVTLSSCRSPLPSSPAVSAAGLLVRFAMRQPPVIWANSFSYFAVSSSFRDLKLWKFLRSASVGKISGFLASSGSMACMASCAPVTGQM